MMLGDSQLQQRRRHVAPPVTLLSRLHWLLFAALIVCITLTTTHAHALHARCNNTLPPRGDVLNIAIMFWGPPAPHPLWNVTAWPRSPLLEGWTGPTALEKAALEGWLLWQERMQLPAEPSSSLTPPPSSSALPAATFTGLRMLDGGTMGFNITYINIGQMNLLSGEDEYSVVYQNSTQHEIIRALADANGRFGQMRLILTPLVSNTALTTLVELACERSETCITIGCGMPQARQFICAPPGTPLQRDCIERGLRAGARRFDHVLSASSNSDWWGAGSMALAVNQKVHRVWVLAETWAIGVLTQLRSTARQLGFVIVGEQIIIKFSREWESMNTTLADMSDRIIGAEVDMVLIVGAFNTPSLHSLLRHWQSIEWTPKVLAYVGNGAVNLPRDLQSYMLVETVWLPTLSGDNFHAVASDTNFEIFPANDTHDSPAVFADAFVSRFQYASIPLNALSQGARAFHSLTIVQKLVELEQSDDVHALLDGASRVAAPSVFHAVQFDQWGRSITSDNYVLQLMPNGEERVLTPLGLGRPPILPMPTWKERVFAPRFYALTSERVLLVFTSLTIFYICCVIAWGVYWWDHAVIRACLPSFCIMSLVGLIMMVSSNFFATTHVTDSMCAAQVWLLSLGVTLAYGSLIIKNLRIYSLWHNTKSSFMPTKLRDPHLVFLIAVLLLSDLIINIAWMTTAHMDAHLTVVDEYRPALSFMSCQTKLHATKFVLAHFATKVLMMGAGIVLAWKLRGVSAQFSEAQYIAICIYNGSVVLAIMLSIVVWQLAGNVENGMLVRGWSLIYLGLSTTTVMAGPKFLHLRAAESKLAQAVAQHKAAVQLTAVEGAGLSQSNAFSLPNGAGGGGDDAAPMFPQLQEYRSPAEAAAAVRAFANAYALHQATKGLMPPGTADVANMHHHAAAHGGSDVEHRGASGLAVSHTPRANAALTLRAACTLLEQEEDLGEEEIMRLHHALVRRVNRRVPVVPSPDDMGPTASTSLLRGSNDASGRGSVDATPCRHGVHAINASPEQHSSGSNNGSSASSNQPMVISQQRAPHIVISPPHTHALPPAHPRPLIDLAGRMDDAPPDDLERGRVLLPAAVGVGASTGTNRPGHTHGRSASGLLPPSDGNSPVNTSSITSSPNGSVRERQNVQPLWQQGHAPSAAAGRVSPGTVSASHSSSSASFKESSGGHSSRSATSADFAQPAVTPVPAGGVVLPAAALTAVHPRFQASAAAVSPVISPEDAVPVDRDSVIAALTSADAPRGSTAEVPVAVAGGSVADSGSHHSDRGAHYHFVDPADLSFHEDIEH